MLGSLAHQKDVRAVLLYLTGVKNQASDDTSRPAEATPREECPLVLGQCKCIPSGVNCSVLARTAF